MKTARLWTLALTAITTAGCVDDATAPREQHCTITAMPSRGGEAPAAAPAPAACFDTFSDAVFDATQGALRLPTDATPDLMDRLAPDQLAAAATYLIAIEYVAPHWDAFWGTLTVTSSVNCDLGYDLWYGSMPFGWNDVISSVRTFPGCAHAFHYEHPNFGGARLDCPPSGCWETGALDDRTSSIRWTNSPI